MYRTQSLIDHVSEQFLLGDSGNEIDRILMFDRPSGLKILNNSKNVYCDINLRVATSVFAQVYVVLEEVLRWVHPIIYALLPLPSKQEVQHIRKVFRYAKKD